MFFHESVKKQFKFKCANDGVCQLAGGVYQICQQLPNQETESLVNQKIAYIGPGTGLGGAFATITSEGLQFYTDGHIFDMEIQSESGFPVGAETVFPAQGSIIILISH